MALDAKTRSMLEQWEVKHGLDVIQERLDGGLFSHDPSKVRLCYAWLSGRRLAPVIRGIVKLVFGSAAFAGSIYTVLAYFKD